ncbi:MAG: hypothetical protein FJ191_11515 [Gammaproteobacteria bacterium]|nr:hypothetical protein [Gammaproteobacteria bacterium]
MQIEGIDRLVIGVRDMDRALAFFRDVLGVQFTELQGPAPDLAGCRLAMSLDQRLELLSPVGEPQRVTNPPDPLELRRRLEQSEAVLYAVVFKVPDLDWAIADAAAHGVPTVGERVAFAREEQFGLTDFAEVALDEKATFGLKLALSQFVRDPKD